MGLAIVAGSYIVTHRKRGNTDFSFLKLSLIDVSRFYIKDISFFSKIFAIRFCPASLKSLKTVEIPSSTSPRKISGKKDYKQVLFLISIQKIFKFL